VDEYDVLHAWRPEWMCTLEASGVAPHKFVSKLGSPIILLRNLTSMLADGMRCICKGFGGRLLLCRGPGKIDPRDARWQFTLHRKQFPMEVAFAMTINKFIGQTTAALGLYL
jgi:ATP-dependent DNA helicase PIF1